MIYKIVSIDGKEDDVTSQTFSNYSDAYDLLNRIYGDTCCSDADYGDNNYYDIVEGQNQPKIKNEKTDKTWETTKEQNIGIISKVYKFI